MKPRLLLLFLLIGLLGLAAALYGRALAFPLTRDDTSHLTAPGMKELYDRGPNHLPDHFREDFWGPAVHSGLYRPLTATTIQLTAWIKGLDPLALRIGNALLLVAAAWAAALLAGRCGVAPIAAAATALLLVTHPLLSETVLEVVSRSETQALLGVVFAAWLLTKERTGDERAGVVRLVGAALAFAFALLSKEGAFAALPALLVIAWQSRRRGPLVALALLLPAALVLVARARVFGDIVGLAQADIPKLDNPLVGEPFGVRLHTGIAGLGHYLELFFWPDRLSIDWSYAAITPVRVLAEPRFFAGAVALLVGLVWLVLALRRGANGRLETFGLLLAGGTWFLTSSIARPVGTIFGERLFCTPAAGIVLALAAALDRSIRNVSSRRLRIGVASGATIVVMAVVVALALRTARRAADWRDGLTLYTAASKVAPDSARVQCTLGFLLGLDGQRDAARPCLERALNILPDYGTAHVNYAALLGSTGQTGPAVVHLWLAVHSPGGGARDAKRLSEAAKKLGSDRRALADFKKYAAELVKKHADLALYRDLGAELVRIGG